MSNNVLLSINYRSNRFEILDRLNPIHEEATSINSEKTNTNSISNITRKKYVDDVKDSN